MKKIFSYFKDVKIVTIMLIFCISAGTAGYIFAYNMWMNVFRPSNLASWTVNITPKWSTNVDENTSRVSYIVSYADIKSSDNSQSAPGLKLIIPKEAKNVIFTLIGTIDKVEKQFISEDGKYTEKSVDVNYPLMTAEIANGVIPTAQEINSGIELTPTIWDNGIISNSHVYFFPGLQTSHPVAIKVEFDISKSSKESHIPIRAYKSIMYFTEVTNDLWIYRDEADILPDIADIETGDFDEHGLYLEANKCSVTRNLSRWDKIGVDITPVVFNYVSFFNLNLNQAVTYYGVTWAEDLCDQAVVTIPAK